MRLLRAAHGKAVFDRRVRVLSRHLLEYLPNQARVLDVGCGNGLIDKVIMDINPNLDIEGIDVLTRERAHIPMSVFNGCSIPHTDKSFDVVLFIDVLHHTENPIGLLAEAARVSRHGIIIKDHVTDGLFATPFLRFMDWVGNAPHRVALPYNYWSQQQWEEAFARLDLRRARRKTKLNLYPIPFSWLFDRSLHFIVELKHST